MFSPLMASGFISGFWIKPESNRADLLPNGHFQGVLQGLRVSITATVFADYSFGVY